MANFIERATLILTDKSTANIKKINRELKTLFDTTRKMRNMSIRLDGLTQTQKQTRSLINDMTRLSRPTRLAVDASSLTRATQQARTLNNVLNNATRTRTARINVSQFGNVGGPAGGGIPTVFGGQGGRRSGIRGISGVGIGNAGLGISNLTLAEAIGATTALTIGHLTVRTLVAETINASRMDLQQEARLTEPQQQAFAQLAPVGREQAVTQRELQSIRAGIVADVRADDPSITAAAAEAVANRTIQSASDIAAARGISFDAALDIVGNQITKVVDLATGSITDAMGRMTDRALAVWDRADQILSQNPELGPQELLTATRGAGVGRMAMSDEDFFALWLATTSQGRRAGTSFRALRANLTGQQRQISNEELAERGLFDLETGQPIDPDLFNTATTAWLQKHLFPALEKEARQALNLRGVTAPTDEQLTGEVGTISQSILGRVNAQDFMTEFFATQEVLDRQLKQAMETRLTAEERQARALANFSTQLDLTSAKVRDTMQELGASLGETILPAVRGIGDVFHGINEAMREGDITPGQVAAGGAVAATGAVMGGRALFQSFFNPLNRSAVALDGSAAALMRAAVALGGQGALPGSRGGRRGGRGMAGAAGAAGAAGTVGRLPLNGLGAVGGVMAFTNALWLGSEIIGDVNSTQAELLDGMRRNHERSQALNDALETRMRTLVGDAPVDLLERDVLQETTGFSVPTATELGDAIRNAFKESERKPIGTSDEAAAARAELETLIARIRVREERAAETGGFGPQGQEQQATLQQRADELRLGLAEWDAILAENRAAMSTTLDTGAQSMGDKVSSSLEVGGGLFAGTLNEAFSNGSAMLADRIQAAIANAPITVRQAPVPTPRPDVGASAPVE
ncbi:hypothetical protein [Neoaquamicrobium sediminum]|uniref:hypothetical protein n=1 Tax=Neoaquamicrobium sediminum TaxID=1849104 RepID=UPI0040350203